MHNVVVASLQSLPGGALRLVLADAVRETSTPADGWTKRALFTQPDLPAVPDDIPDAALADIGLNLVPRLRAANGLGT
jgi:hypothetical protein